MEKKRVLLVTQEIEPYTEGTEMSSIMAKLPKFLSDNGYELRILMPRFSCVNERRHRLHEVVRLSGMNIIVDDDDYPLLIKVASLPNSRLQVYFLDNDEFFKRSTIYGTPEEPFEDNVDRSAFFCKGAVEIVKKFGWSPDIVLCEGFLTGLMPLFLRTAYKTEPLFSQAAIVYGLFDAAPFEQMEAERFFAKAAINNLKPADIEPYRNPDGTTASVHRGATAFSDAVIIGTPSFDPDAADYLNAEGKVVQRWDSEETFFANILQTFNTLLEVPADVA
jgi:starch synthase